jgi:type I restriction enzyme M protein
MIFTDPEFVAYKELVNGVSVAWQADVRPRIWSLAPGCRPRQVIEEASEGLLKAFADVWLLDKYDLYQRLMTYWAETMQDDVYLVATDGWQASADLTPPPLVIARYFAAEQAAVTALEAAREAVGQQIEELDEEHGGEGGLLEEARNEKGKLTRAGIKTRVKQIFDDPEAVDELAALNRYLALIDQEAEAAKRVREAQRALDAQVTAKYKALCEDEIKTLVVDDKWLATLAADVQTELDRVSQALTGRIKELAERYAAPLPALTGEVDALSARVDAHLGRMGLIWK